MRTHRITARLSASPMRHLPTRAARVALFAASMLAASAAWSAPPAWMSQPPRDSADVLWGTGEGPTLEQARQHALRNVAAGLRSAIAGKVERRVSDSNGRIDKFAASTLSEDILKTEFSRYQVERTESDRQGVYVLVKVDRPAFINDTQTRLGVLQSAIGPAEAAQSDPSRLEQLLALRRVAPQLEQAVVLSQLLAGAGLEREGLAGVARYAGLQERARQVASSLVFSVRAAPADGDVAVVLARHLTDQGMRASTRAEPGAAQLMVKTDARSDELFGSKIQKLRIQLAVVDGRGSVVAQRDYDVSGSSRYDFRAARAAALAKLADELSAAGGLQALGFAP